MSGPGDRHPLLHVCRQAAYGVAITITITVAVATGSRA
jgi:hypothetical protein